MPTWARVLMMMPWLLIIIGGLIGGIFAGLGMELNRRIARADIRVPVKVVSMLLCTALAGTLWFGSVFALSWLFAPVPEYADGACSRAGGPRRRTSCRQPTCVRSIAARRTMRRWPEGSASPTVPFRASRPSPAGRSRCVRPRSRPTSACRMSDPACCCSGPIRARVCGAVVLETSTAS